MLLSFKAKCPQSCAVQGVLDDSPQASKQYLEIRTEPAARQAYIVMDHRYGKSQHWLQFASLAFRYTSQKSHGFLSLRMTNHNGVSHSSHAGSAGQTCAEAAPALLISPTTYYLLAALLAV